MDEGLTHRLLQTLFDLVPMDRSRRWELVETARAREKASLCVEQLQQQQKEGDIKQERGQQQQLEPIRDLTGGKSILAGGVPFTQIPLRDGLAAAGDGGSKVYRIRAAVGEDVLIPLSEVATLCIKKEAEEGAAEGGWSGQLSQEHQSLLMALSPFNMENSWQESMLAAVLNRPGMSDQVCLCVSICWQFTGNQCSCGFIAGGNLWGIFFCWSAICSSWKKCVMLTIKKVDGGEGM